MTTRRRKAPVNEKTAKSPKKRSIIWSAVEEPSETVDVPELYRKCVLNPDDVQRQENIRLWEERGAVANVVWPFLVANVESKDFFHGCHLLVIFVSYHCSEGAFRASMLDVLHEECVIDKVLDTLFYKTEQIEEYGLHTRIVHFVDIALSCDNETLKKSIFPHVSGLKIWHWMPERRRELELKRSSGLRRKFAELEKGRVWIVKNVQNILHLLEGHSSWGMLLSLEGKKDADSMTVDVPEEVWNFIYRSFEMMIDLLSTIHTRLFLIPYLDSIHFGVRCRLAVGHHFALPEKIRLIQQLLARINRLLAFPIQDATQKHLSKVDVVSMYHARASTLQKMAYRHYPRQLQQVTYASVGLLCAPPKKNSYLERSFVGFSDLDLQSLLHKLRLIDGDDQSISRDFLLQVLSEYMAIPPYPMDQLKSFPLYPNESLLWDHNIIPPSNAVLRAAPVLALPKLNRQFLSYQDYLLRNFELVRLESAYEIRTDLVQAVKRIRPLLRQSNLDEFEEIQLKTEFSGWSRMALELAQPVDIVEVQPPKLGETINSKIVAEFTVDLSPCGDAIRREWNELGEFDNLFLLTIDASRMTGSLAPLLKDFHLHHGSHKQWDSDNGERRIPDDEDSTFPQRFGVTLVRGCMIVQVRNEAGTIVSEPGVAIPLEEVQSTKRIFKVLLDPAQYAMDSKSKDGTDVYKVSIQDFRPCRPILSDKCAFRS